MTLIFSMRYLNAVAGMMMMMMMRTVQHQRYLVQASDGWPVRATLNEGGGSAGGWIGYLLL